MNQNFNAAAESTADLKTVRTCFEVGLRYRKSVIDWLLAYFYFESDI